jgi:undecaprenyl-diphosphatase
VLDALLHADAEAVEAVAALRWEPLTAVFVAASAGVVKGPLFLLAAGARDVVQRRLLPLHMAVVAVAFALTTLVTGWLKELFDRPRPPDDADPVTSLVELPTSASFPSGHASTAFAAAVALGVLVPRWRAPALAVAALVAFSRVYLGVHFWLDVFAGALLGAAFGWFVARAALGLTARHEH